MELNDINLLVLTGLISFSLIGLSLFLTIYGGFFGFVSPIVAERIWPWILTIVGNAGVLGHRISKVLKAASFLLVWIVGPVAAVWLGIQAVSWFDGLNKSPRLIEHGREAGEELKIGEMTLRWIPMPENSDSCWMLDSEVSQRLWRNVMGEHPVCFQRVGHRRSFGDPSVVPSVSAAGGHARHPRLAPHTPHAHLQGDAALCDALRHHRRYQGQGEGFACSIFLHVVDGAVPFAPHVRGRARCAARQVRERHFRLVVGDRDVYEVRHAWVLSHYDFGSHHRRGRIRSWHLPDCHPHGHHLVRAYRTNQKSQLG